MKKQLVNVSAVQAAKVFAIFYVLMTLPFLVIFGGIMLSTGQLDGGATFGLLLAPALYGVIAFIGTLIAAWAYNFVASKAGGIEFTTADAPAS